MVFTANSFGTLRGNMLINHGLLGSDKPILMIRRWFSKLHTDTGRKELQKKKGTP